MSARTVNVGRCDMIAAHNMLMDTADRDCANVTVVGVCESDGSDGYSAGTWRWYRIEGGWSGPVAVSSAGGFASADLAAEAEVQS